MSEFFKDYEPIPKTVNGTMYCDLLRRYAAPAFEKLYPGGSACWQDGPATIHWCTAALETVNELFSRRLDPTKQCPKFSDAMPIENVWGIVKQQVGQKKCETLAEIKREITRVWRNIDADKPLLARLMSSIPVRCKAVMEANGDQIR